VGAIETAATRSSAGPQKVIILADGAKSIWGIAEEYFPGATEIVDLYHAREHLAKVAKLLYGVNTPQSQERLAARRDELDEGNVEAVIAALSGSRLGDSAKLKKKCKRRLNTSAAMARMRYAEFRSQGLFVGSGVVEAGWKTIFS